MERLHRREAEREGRLRVLAKHGGRGLDEQRLRGRSRARLGMRPGGGRERGRRYRRQHRGRAFWQHGYVFVCSELCGVVLFDLFFDSCTVELLYRAVSSLW